MLTIHILLGVSLNTLKNALVIKMGERMLDSTSFLSLSSETSSPEPLETEA
jgi:hypothetical protein